MTRVAVYFTGHLRNLSNTWANYKRFFSDPSIQFHFYFTLWRKSHTTTNDSWDKINASGKIFVDIYDITEKDVYSICPEAKYVKIIDTVTHDKEYLKYSPNIVSQLYGISDMISNIPNDYDYYIRMRTDLYFFKAPNWSECLGDFVVPEDVHWNKINYFSPISNIFNDYFWVANYSITREIADIYKNILTYPKGLTTEWYFARHMTKKNLIPDHYRFEIALERRTRGFEDTAETRFYTERRKREGDFV